MRVPFITQIQASDNGAAALAMMLGYYKRFVSLQEMRNYCISSRNGSSPDQICTCAGSGRTDILNRNRAFLLLGYCNY